MKTIGIDFGGTAIKLAVMEDGRIVNQTSIPAFARNGLKARLADTKQAVLKIAGDQGLKGVSCVGISMPGIVDPVRKRPVGLIGKYEDSLEMDLESWCREAFGLPMVMEMDSKLALLGELHYGCARGFQDAAMLILGTGVGTAVAYQGTVLKSRHYTAGALSSHIIIDINGPDCICSNRGCLESMASGWALERLVKQDPGYEKSGLSGEETLDFRVLQKWYKRQDPAAVRVVRHCVKAWRTGILNLIHAYDPEAVVLSGGIMNFEGLYEMLSEGIQDDIWDCCGSVEIRKAKDPENSVLYGLHYLCGHPGV